MTATLYFSLLQTEQEQYEIFMCLHADVYTCIQRTAQTTRRTGRHHLTFLPVQWYKCNVQLKIFYLPWEKCKQLSEKDWGHGLEGCPYLTLM